MLSRTTLSHDENWIQFFNSYFHIREFVVYGVSPHPVDMYEVLYWLCDHPCGPGDIASDDEEDDKNMGPTEPRGSLGDPLRPRHLDHMRFLGDAVIHEENISSVAKILRSRGKMTRFFKILELTFLVEEGVEYECGMDLQAWEEAYKEELDMIRSVCEDFRYTFRVTFE